MIQTTKIKLKLTEKSKSKHHTLWSTTAPPYPPNNHYHHIPSIQHTTTIPYKPTYQMQV